MKKSITVEWEEGPKGTEGEPDYEPALDATGQRRIVVFTGPGTPGENGYAAYVPDNDYYAASTAANLISMWGLPAAS